MHLRFLHYLHGLPAHFYHGIIFHFINVPQFIHSPFEKYLDCFQMLTIMNKATINICVHVLLDVNFQLFGVNIKKDDCSTHDSEQLFTYLFVICISSLVTYVSLQIFCPFFSRVVCFLTVVFQEFFGQQFFFRSISCKCFLPLCGLSFHSLDIVFHWTNIFNIINSNLSIFPFMDCAYGVVS